MNEREREMKYRKRKKIGKKKIKKCIRKRQQNKKK